MSKHRVVCSLDNKEFKELLKDYVYEDILTVNELHEYCISKDIVDEHFIPVMGIISIIEELGYTQNPTQTPIVKHYTIKAIKFSLITHLDTPLGYDIQLITPTGKSYAFGYTPGYELVNMVMGTSICASTDEQELGKISIMLPDFYEQIIKLVERVETRI